MESSSASSRGYRTKEPLRIIEVRNMLSVLYSPRKQKKKKSGIVCGRRKGNL